MIELRSHTVSLMPESGACPGSKGGNTGATTQREERQSHISTRACGMGDTVTAIFRGYYHRIVITTRKKRGGRRRGRRRSKKRKRKSSRPPPASPVTRRSTPPSAAEPALDGLRSTTCSLVTLDETVLCPYVLSYNVKVRLLPSKDCREF